MAKQAGVHKLHGKVDEQSYYYSKNGGYMTRKINPGISARVKTAAEYANTRLNNAEFGGSGASAGAIVRGITQRHRFILSPIATGMLNKAIKKAMMLDSTNAWGKRQVPVDAMPEIQDKLNQMSKNEFPSDIKSFIATEMTITRGENFINVASNCVLSADTAERLKALGADGVAIALYAYNVDAPKPLTDENGYEIPVNRAARLSAVEGSVVFGGQSQNIITSGTAATTVKPFNTEYAFGGVLAVLLPFKTVGSVNYTLQELCSACWIAIVEEH